MDSGEVSGLDRWNVGLIDEMRANSAGKIWVFQVGFLSKFRLFFSRIFRGFSMDFQGWEGKSDSDLMRQIAWKPMIYKKNKKMRVLPSTHPAVAQGSHKGASPLDPRRPLRQLFLWEGKSCVWARVWIRGIFTKDKKDAENAAAKMPLRSLEECENSTLQ